ncbi:NAD(P)-binding protein [Pseudovirgaria hyperparasitica]|uniref:NAD(P)-binding protein n=1 Tax=Pseudovirgaria hyperparasitica TaxID=470096 RepID=A0A6A6W286_9PEZI|nr:NAD(P)-binding protein [Pseudovirgaria hyperparasitica]KAF2755131.1 NAD(P)-binding protein [Pseudovirgaria hyperparasitica]
MVYFGGFYVVLVVFIAASVVLSRLISRMNTTPPEILPLSPNRVTRKEILEAYERVKKSPIDVRKFIPPATGRRYIIVGGSGLVGGWIAQHLLMRGEKPAAIRIVDVKPNIRPDVKDRVAFIKTDITDAAAVKSAFSSPWPSDIAGQPLTVFHSAAIINSFERAEDLMGPVFKVNVNGTANVIEAAKEAKASILISTSSSSIALVNAEYFAEPFARWPKNLIQVIDNADPPKPVSEMKHYEYCGNYAKSKHLGETLVLQADNKSGGFRTGSIRPGHAIYGHGVEDNSSVTWQYLNRAGAPSWITNYVQNLVNAQNVSIAHLLFEFKLVDPSPKKDLGGRAYCVVDPKGPIVYVDLYQMLTTLSKTPINFPYVPAFPMLCVAHLVEVYATIQRRYATFLPPLSGDIKNLQPALFQMCTKHIAFNDKAAREDLGYKGPIASIDGIAEDVYVWNRNFEAKSAAEKKQATQNIEEAKPVVPVPLPTVR